MVGETVQVLGAGRAGTATLCYLDAKDTLLIAQYSNLRDFFSLASFKKSNSQENEDRNIEEI